MTEIRKMTAEDIEQCVCVYCSAYSAEPWKEEYHGDQVGQYLSGFMSAESMESFVMTEDGEIVGIALTILVPSMDSPYLRLEDFCIRAELHGMGYGSRFIELLAAEAKKKGCDSILLGTQHGFPSHSFYLKNGFSEIESVLMYREI